MRGPCHRSPPCSHPLSAALLQKYLDNYDLSIRVIYVLGTLGFSVGTAVMAMFANVYVAMAMVSTMGVVSMSISYCPYALLGQYHDIKEVRLRPQGLAGSLGRESARSALPGSRGSHTYAHSRSPADSSALPQGQSSLRQSPGSAGLNGP